MNVLLLLASILAVLNAASLHLGLEDPIVNFPNTNVGWSSNYHNLNGARTTTFSLHGGVKFSWEMNASVSINLQGEISVATNSLTKALVIHGEKYWIVQPNIKEVQRHVPRDVMVVLAGSQAPHLIDGCLRQIAAAKTMNPGFIPEDAMSLVQALGADNKCANISLLATRTVAASLPPRYGAPVTSGPNLGIFSNGYLQQLRQRLGPSPVALGGVGGRFFRY